MTFYIAPIIEGQTEAGCVERLLQRVWTELLSCPVRLQVLQPSRGNRDRLIHPAGADVTVKIEEAFAKLSQRLRREPSGRGLLFLLIDAEENCPKELAIQLLHKGRQARPDVDIACVLAKRMFENWFAAAATSLMGVNGLPSDLQIPDQIEERSGVLWLNKQLRSVDPRRKYTKTVDAKAFVSRMDLCLCRANSPSFDKFCRELAQHAAAI